MNPSLLKSFPLCLSPRSLSNKNSLIAAIGRFNPNMKSLLKNLWPKWSSETPVLLRVLLQFDYFLLRANDAKVDYLHRVRLI